MTTPMAMALADDGWNVWNAEYRCTGQASWKETLADCLAASRHVVELADELGIDIARTLLVGHSAGGHLAAWVAASLAHRAPAEAAPISGLVTLNGVLDLGYAARARIGDDAVPEFLGALPHERPDVYREADPTAGGSFGVPFRCLHSRSDDRVPFELSEHVVRVARLRGEDVRLIAIPGHHTAPIEVASVAWPVVLTTINALADAHLAQLEAPVR
jgi:acetyl esterase/lipase